MTTQQILRTTFLCMAVLIVDSRVVGGQTMPCALAKAILRVPISIKSPGIYCFARNVSFDFSTGIALRIDSDNVVLDMNGFTLRGTAGSGTDADGIFVFERRNVTIKNGTVQGFRFGVNVVVSRANVIERLRVTENYFAGISASGLGNLIRNNHVAAIGGSALLNAIGISVTGPGATVMDNDLIEITGSGIGSGNGIEFSAIGTDGIAMNNRITNADTGVVFSGGADGKYRDNLTVNVVTPYVGGTDAGNNQ